MSKANRDQILLPLDTPAVLAHPDGAQHASAAFDHRSGDSVESIPERRFAYGDATLLHCDCMSWLERQAPNSIHAVVTDPPYGLVEYSDNEQSKLRQGKGGIWRIPPSFDGNQGAPVPRFTVLKRTDLDALEQFFLVWATRLLPVLVPGANVVVASNPLLSHIVSGALARAGMERRGELVRLTMTMRGGDRPKHAHVEFAG